MGGYSQPGSRSPPLQIEFPVTNGTCDRNVGGVLRWTLILTVVAFAGVSTSAAADSVKIKKVLWFYLDKEGRQSLSPSLFDRDAYQAELRSNPAKRSGLRFDVQWVAPAGADLVLRVEMRGAVGTTNTTATAQGRVKKNGPFSRWTRLKLSDEEYGKLGELVAWRATLHQGDLLVAEHKSFLW